MDLDKGALLEELCDRSMPGLHRRQLGDWVLRASLGATGRANSVWATGQPDTSMISAVDQVEAWYTEQGLRPFFQVFRGTTPDLIVELDGRGYGSVPGAIIMVGSVEEVRAESEPYRVVPRSTRSWAKPSPSYASLLDNTDRLAEITTTRLPQHCAVTFDEQENPLGGGLATLDGDWLGLFAMMTIPSARRQGVASVVLNELVRRGIEGGADSVWLQVMPDNHAAISLYRGLGMVEVHGYHYRSAPRDPHPRP